MSLGFHVFHSISDLPSNRRVARKKTEVKPRSVQEQLQLRSSEPHCKCHSGLRALFVEQVKARFRTNLCFLLLFIFKTHSRLQFFLQLFCFLSGTLLSRQLFDELLLWFVAQRRLFQFLLNFLLFGRSIDRFSCAKGVAACRSRGSRLAFNGFTASLELKFWSFSFIA